MMWVIFRQKCVNFYLFFCFCFFLLYTDLNALGVLVRSIHLNRTNRNTCPIFTLAKVPRGFRKAFCTNLQPFSSTQSIFVDVQDMKGMNSVLKRGRHLCGRPFPTQFVMCLSHSTRASFGGFTRYILFHPRDKMDTKWKFNHSFLFHAQIIYTELRIRNTPAVYRLWI